MFEWKNWIHWDAVSIDEPCLKTEHFSGIKEGGKITSLRILEFSLSLSDGLSVPAKTTTHCLKSVCHKFNKGKLKCLWKMKTNLTTNRTQSHLHCLKLTRECWIKKFKFSGLQLINGPSWVKNNWWVMSLNCHFYTKNRVRPSEYIFV